MVLMKDVEMLGRNHGAHEVEYDAEPLRLATARY